MFKLRQAQGILGMRDKHTPARLDAACRKALDAGDPSYRTIKGILALGAEADPVPRPAGDGGAAAFLHGPSLLFGDASTLPNPIEQPSGPTVNVNGDHAGHPAR
jgi:hypothetical protein